MVISSEKVVEENGWLVKKIFEDGEFSHYALKHELDSGASVNPFDEVRASGGLLKLKYNQETSVTFTGVIDGLNTYTDDADMPKSVFTELKEIGPY